MRRIIVMAGKCDRCPEGSIALQVAPFRVSRRFWIYMGVAFTLGLFIGVLR